MARPQQEIILSLDSGTDYLDVIASEGLWAVVYMDKPINIRRQLWILTGVTHKYLKVVYPNPGHAYRTVMRLNTHFNTDLFAVKQIL